MYTKFAELRKHVTEFIKNCIKVREYRCFYGILGGAELIIMIYDGFESQFFLSVQMENGRSWTNPFPKYDYGIWKNPMDEEEDPEWNLKSLLIDLISTLEGFAMDLYPGLKTLEELIEEQNNNG